MGHPIKANASYIQPRCEAAGDLRVEIDKKTQWLTSG